MKFSAWRIQLSPEFGRCLNKDIRWSETSAAEAVVDADALAYDDADQMMVAVVVVVVVVLVLLSLVVGGGDGIGSGEVVVLVVVEVVGWCVRPSVSLLVWDIDQPTFFPIDISSLK